MSINYAPKMVNSGLVIYLDAANTTSYSGSGSLWYDISGRNKSFALNVISQPTFSNGNFQFQSQYGYLASVLDADIQTDMTIECWYMPISMKAGCCHTVFGAYDFRFFHIGDYVYMMIGADNGSGTRVWMHPQFYLTNNVWHNVVLNRRDFQRYIIWVDGVQVYNTADYSGLNLWSNKNDWYISGEGHTNVKIAICKAYSRGLSDAEMLQNYNALRGRFGL